ncbi:Aste57867_12727 [Aphanomyces stellatus]|uniref:Aste57867_12727 protein n=1 Tax=Aphanomyces stellatus TaxID=120398 RepID=A0A485KWQ3_9STRA|nr:hypothetical protein As57867_012679 [Aphanomyces stellatus]VFT89577.1 Aste57867_12727 [Aphanomyces stellatus]
MLCPGDPLARHRLESSSRTMFAFNAAVVPSHHANAPSSLSLLERDTGPLLPVTSIPSSSSSGSPSKDRMKRPTAFWTQPRAWLLANQTKLYGLSMIAGGNVVLSVMTVLVKTAGKYLTSDEVVFWRCSIAVLCNIAFQLALKIPPFAVPPQFRVLVFLRSILGYVAMSLSFYSYNTMVLSEASVIICSAPIVTFVLGIGFLREKLDRLDFVCTFVSFLGVVCVARPAFLFGLANSTTSPPFSLVTAVLAAIFLGIANIFIRKLHDLNTWTLVTCHLTTTAFFAGLKVLVFHSGFTIPTEPSRIVTLLAIGVLGCLGQVMVTKGFQVEKAGIASAMQYINTMCIMVWDVTLLGQTLHAFSVVGAAIIISSSTVVAYRRTKKA